MKKKPARPHIKRLSHTLLITFGVVSLVAVVIISLTAAYAYNRYVYQNRVSHERLGRIIAIYDSLHLSPDYTLTGQDVFGDKRIYDWDHSRTYASWRTYARQVDVSVALAELSPAIERAGFTEIDEPYPNSSFKELHYRNQRGEYLRLNIASQPYNDAWRAASSGNYQPTNLPNPNNGPSEITIKVNLDDNNE